jgi:hypothetical protein
MRAVRIDLWAERTAVYDLIVFLILKDSKNPLLNGISSTLYPFNSSFMKGLPTKPTF